MREKGKILAVVNTDKRAESVVSESVTSKGTKVSFGGASSSVDLSAYLLKSVWEKAFEIKTDANGMVYLFGKLPVVTQYGVTMYSGEGGDVNIPSIYDGLPIDGETLYWDALYDEEGNVIGKVLKAQGGGSGGGGVADSVAWTNVTGKPSWLIDNKISYSEIDGTPDLSVYALKSAIPSLNGYATEQWVTNKGYATTSDLDSRVNALINGAPAAYDTLKEIADVLQGNVNSIGDIITTLGTKWTQDDVKINSWDTAFSWGNHATAGYAKKTYVDSTFVTLGGNEDVSGIKNFSNGIKLSGIEFKYDSENNAVCLQKADGTPINFYVTGGMSMYGQGNTSVKSIMDAIAANLDRNTLDIKNGLLTVVGGTGGVDEDAVRTLIESYDYATKDFVRDYVLENATGGEFELSKKMVIDALGYTPYSAANPNGYITAASLDSYLPKSGGTISSSNQTPLNINSTSDSNRSFIIFKHNGVNKAYIGYTTANGAFIENPTSGNRLCILDNLLYNDKTVYHSGNLTKLSQLTDDVVSGKYLPLSGGTVNGIIKLNYTSKKSAGIAFKNNRTEESSSWAVTVMSIMDVSESIMARIGVFGTAKSLSYLYVGHNNYDGNNLRIYTDKVTFGDNTIWHAGNDGSGSGLDADLLDGLQPSELDVLSSKVLQNNADTIVGYDLRYRSSMIVQGEDVDGAWVSPTGNYTSGNNKVEYAGILRLGRTSKYYNDLFFNMNTGYPQWRQVVNGNHKGWKTFAFTDSNVASATKLQTARTIWGQSFDGSADVTGSLKIPNDYTLRWFNNAGADINCMYLSNENKFFIGNGVAEKGYDTYLSGRNLTFRYGTSRTVGAILNSSGNITVGATDLAGTDSKLYVNGTAIIGNNVAGGELLKFNMERPWTFIQEASGSDSKLVLKPTQNSKYFIVKNANNEKLLLCLALNGGNIIEIGGTLRLDNNKNLQAKDTSGAYINLLGLNSSNQLSIGYGLNSKGYVMELGGKIVNFYYGTERTLGMVLNENGNLVPSTSNTYALGAYNNNWSYIYTTGIRRWDGSTANETPLLHGESNNTNITLLRVSHASSSYFAQTGAYGFTLKYFGTGGGNANYLKLLADNKTASSQVIALCVDQAGNVGVGCDTNEEYKLRVYGTGYFSSNLLIGGGLTYYSQRSLKNVIDERGLSLAELSAIKPTRYTWKDKRDDRIHIGGIADDVMTVLPEVVYKTADETLTMDYGNAGFAVASSLIKPVVDHEKRIIDHDERIKVLERENKELKERLNKLSA